LPAGEAPPCAREAPGGDSSSPTQPADYPFYLEGGTPNVIGIVGMVAGLDFVEKETPVKLWKHELALCDASAKSFWQWRASRSSDRRMRRIASAR